MNYLLLEMKGGAFPSSLLLLQDRSAGRNLARNVSWRFRRVLTAAQGIPVSSEPMAEHLLVESDGRREVCLRPELQRGMETYLVRVPSDSKINHGIGMLTRMKDILRF